MYCTFRVVLLETKVKEKTTKFRENFLVKTNQLFFFSPISHDNFDFFRLSYHYTLYILYIRVCTYRIWSFCRADFVWTFESDTKTNRISSQVSLHNLVLHLSWARTMFSAPVRHWKASPSVLPDYRKWNKCRVHQIGSEEGEIDPRLTCSLSNHY